MVIKYGNYNYNLDILDVNVQSCVNHIPSFIALRLIFCLSENRLFLYLPLAYLPFVILDFGGTIFREIHMENICPINPTLWLFNIAMENHPF